MKRWARQPERKISRVTKRKCPARAKRGSAAGVATAGVGSAHSMDGERCDMELAPSTPQGVEIFTTSKHQLLVEDSHLPVSRQENKDHLKDLGELLMDQMSSILDKIDKHAQGMED